RRARWRWRPRGSRSSSRGSRRTRPRSACRYRRSPGRRSEAPSAAGYHPRRGIGELPLAVLERWQPVLLATALGGADHLAQDARGRRLEDVLIEAGADRARPVLGLAPSGERREVDLAAVELAQRARDLVPAEIGQPDVEQHDVGMERVGFIERARPA